MLKNFSGMCCFSLATRSRCVSVSNEPGGLGGFLVALRQVIEARGGISEAARKSGLARQSIYRALSPNGNPTITTLAQLTSVAGLQFTLSKSSH
ncbi:TPA: DNA-binding protein [Escherichia coli]